MLIRENRDGRPKLRATAISPESRRRFGNRSLYRPNPPFLKGGKGDYFFESRNRTDLVILSNAKDLLAIPLLTINTKGSTTGSTTKLNPK